MTVDTVHRLGWTVLGAGALLWAVNLILLGMIQQDVSYTVCAGPLLHIPPGTLHWPPQGHNLYLVDWHHAASLAAIGGTVVGTFLILQGSPGVAVRQRLMTLLGSIAVSLLGAAVLWLAVQYDLVSAHVQALVGCL